MSLSPEPAMPGTSPRRAVVLQHHDRITLGNLEPVLRAHGYDIRVVDATTEDVAALDPLDGDLLIVLGGEQGAYETDVHPHLADELALLRARIDAQRPVFGVCLGAQLMAGALGAENYKGAVPDFGFRELEITEAGLDSPVRHLVGVNMLEWHGDHFTLPEGATLLATSPAYDNEAYALGDFGLAVQFHPEITQGMYEWWTRDAEPDLVAAGIDIEQWRAAGVHHNPAMQLASNAMFGEWLAGLRH